MNNAIKLNDYGVHAPLLCTVLFLNTVLYIAYCTVLVYKYKLKLQFKINIKHSIIYLVSTYVEYNIIKRIKKLYFLIKNNTPLLYCTAH